MLDLAIIGGGPAGLTAGLYATRGGLANVVMFEMGMPGGRRFAERRMAGETSRCRPSSNLESARSRTCCSRCLLRGTKGDREGAQSAQVRWRLVPSSPRSAQAYKQNRMRTLSIPPLVLPRSPSLR